MPDSRQDDSPVQAPSSAASPGGDATGTARQPDPPLRPERRSGPARPSLASSVAGPRPEWLKVRLSPNRAFHEVRGLVHEARLHTVCESASCPNIGECWSARTLTFMILGNVCTRSCGFCDVETGRPGAVDPGEPARIAASLAQLDLRYAVITSVDRDDLPDGGALAWAQTIRAIRASCPGLQIETLTPDFRGDTAALDVVLDERPDVWAHNVETIARLHRVVRPQARYERSLAVLRHAAARAASVKSGIMVGLGETDEEVLTTLGDLASAGVRIVSIGQYMRPSLKHLPVTRWVHPDQFAAYREAGEKLGFAHVESGPLVRSSYHAERQARAAAGTDAGPSPGTVGAPS